MFTILGLKGTDAVVFAIVYSYCKSKDGYVGGYKYIANKIGVSLNSVIRSVKKLEMLGYISIEHNMGEANTIKCNGLHILEDIENCIENLDDFGHRKLDNIVKKLKTRVQNYILQGELNVY
jgi:Mn-dependent DtxR family transcriptional regulator